MQTPWPALTIAGAFKYPDNCYDERLQWELLAMPWRTKRGQGLAWLQLYHLWFARASRLVTRRYYWLPPNQLPFNYSLRLQHIKALDFIYIQVQTSGNGFRGYFQQREHRWQGVAARRPWRSQLPRPPHLAQHFTKWSKTKFFYNLFPHTTTN